MGGQVGQFQLAQPPQKHRPAPVQQPQDVRVGGGQRRIVHGHQGRRAFGQAGGRAQAQQDLPRHAPAALVVPGEVGRAVGVLGAAGGLAQVVQQRGPAQHARAARIAVAGQRLRQCVRFDRPHSHGRVLPDVITVPAARLCAADAGQDLRQRPGQDLPVLRQHTPGLRPGQQLVQLGKNAFRRYQRNAAAAAPRGRGRARLQRKTQLRRKPRRAQHAQRVLGKAGVGVADTAQHPGAQVRLPAERVDQTGGRGPGHRVDREIPPRQVFLHIGNKAHGVWVAAVAVGAVSAEGRDLPAFAAFHHGHRAVLFPVQQQAAALEQRFDLAGLRACADIPVLRRAAKQAVPHAAAHNERLVPGRLQRAQQRSHHRRQGQLQFGLHRRPPFTFFGVSQNAMFRLNRPRRPRSRPAPAGR